MRLNTLFLSLWIAVSGFSQQLGDIYGLNFSTSQLTLASVNATSGQVNLINPAVTTGDIFGSGISDIDADGLRYFYIRAGQVVTMDLQTGNILYAPAITCATHSFSALQPISNIAYDPFQDKIYGLLHYGSQLWFAEVDPQTGVMTVLSNGPISADLYQSGVSDIDPINGRYFYVRAGTIVTVDIASASIVSQPLIQNPNGAVSAITNIAYNWLTDEINGLNYVGSTWGPNGNILTPAELRFCELDPTTGALSITSSTFFSLLQQFLYRRWDVFFNTKHNCIFWWR